LKNDFFLAFKDAMYLSTQSYVMFLQFHFIIARLASLSSVTVDL